MASLKSLLCRIEIDTASRKHSCRRNAAHTVFKGDARLKVRDGRSWKHYCLTCATQIVAKDLATLTTLQSAIAVAQQSGKQ